VLNEELSESVTEALELVGPATSVAPAIHVGQDLLGGEVEGG